MNTIFIEKVNILFKMLGCTNADIADCMGCNSSNVSRIRTGAREYAPTDAPILRFAEGIFLYADRENIVTELCLICGTEQTNRDTLVSKIIEWLYSSEKTDISQYKFKHVKKKQSVRYGDTRSFGERLNKVLLLVELSNARLAKIINVDYSLISRFRCGLRSPKSNPQIMALLAETLYLRAESQGKICELARLCKADEGVFQNTEEGIELFSDWLYNHEEEKNISKVEGLLNFLDEFSSEKTPKLPSIDVFLSDSVLSSNQEVYWGIEGLREAVIRFLGRAKDCASELWLYSDEDTKWLTEDKIFFAKWYALLLACVKNGVRIKIIHNVDRSTDEMIAAIQSWLPLYMSGKIDSYVCKKSRDIRFSHTFFINPNKESISSFYVSASEKMWYDYHLADEKQTVIEQEFEYLLSSSQPLIKIYPKTEINPLLELVSGNRLTAMLTTLSLATMPEQMMIDVLERSEIDKKTFDNIVSFAANQHSRLEHTLQKGEVIEFVPLPTQDDLLGGRVPINISSSLCNTTLYYNVEEYAQHVKAVMMLLESNKNYVLYPVSRMPFDGIQIISSEKSVTVIRSKPPYLAFEITEPLLRRAIDEYIQTLSEKYCIYRQDIKDMLTKYI